MSKGQTDFGKIYYKRPKEIFFPKSVPELRQIVSKLYNEEKKFTIRNTGHSVNGQTLTEDYQIDISNLKEINFNPQEMTVTCLAGNTWSEVFEAILFPKNALPVFPNNPGQNIQIGGTVSVGGVGPYSFKYGGLWNYILELEAVLPNGDLITCNKEQNNDYFNYLIAGFGKIGIITKITFQVIKSKSKVSILEILDFSDQKYLESIRTLLNHPKITGLNGISKGGSFFFTNPHALMIIIESDNLEQDFNEINNLFPEKILKLVLKEHKNEYFDFNFKFTKINKKQIFNYYPVDLKRNHINGIHPWSDFIFDIENYEKFLPILRNVIKNYDLEKYILTQSFLDGKFSINMMPTYIGKNIGTNFPLVPEVVKNSSDYNFGIGFMPTIPKKLIPKTINAIKDLTQITYSLNGKRYLYGISSLSEKDLEKQFGKDVLNKWRFLKKEVDPKNLLNPDVIFQ